MAFLPLIASAFSGGGGASGEKSTAQSTAVTQGDFGGGTRIFGPVVAGSGRASAAEGSVLEPKTLIIGGAVIAALLIVAALLRRKR